MHWDSATKAEVLVWIAIAEKKNRGVTVSTKWLRKILAALEKISRGHDGSVVFIAECALKGKFIEE